MYISMMRMEPHEESNASAAEAPRSPASAPTPYQRSSTLGESRALMMEDLDLEQSRNVSTAPVPVLIKSLALGYVTPLPAVRMTSVRHVDSIGIFPLSRIELGEVWWRPEDVQQWEINPIEGGWRQALISFRDFIDYPIEYLKNIMSVLRTQQYMDGTPFKWSWWKRACRTTNELMNAVMTCPKCSCLRSLSMRTLFSISKDMRDIALECSHMGVTCHTAHPTIIDTLYLGFSMPPNPEHELKQDANEPPTPGHDAVKQEGEEAQQHEPPAQFPFHSNLYPKSKLLIQNMLRGHNISLQTNPQQLINVLNGRKNVILIPLVLYILCLNNSSPAIL